MYLRYFGLTEKPFNITPDPRFLYMSEQHREALAHLLFSTDESSSFIVLTGEVGAGKTTLCRSMLEEGVEGSRFALILNPMQSPLELLASACDEFGIDYPADPGIKDLVDALNRWLLARNTDNEQAILVIDEAQNLGFDTLEQIRLLTNLETGTKKLLKIILIGQPELREMLARPELRQLSQRVTARYHLQPMNAAETAAYVRHRLRVAGVSRALFTPAALKRIHRHAGGIPRKINLIADRALTGAYARQRDSVDAGMVRRAAAEVAHGAAVPPRKRWNRLAVAAVLILSLLLPLLAWRYADHPAPLQGAGEIAATPVTTPPQPHDDYTAALQQALAEGADEPETTPPPPSATTTAPIAELMRLWGVTIDAADPTPACDQASAQGWQCLYLGGTIDDFVALDRPALIEAAGSPPRQWLIRSFDGDSFLLANGDEVESLDHATLQRRWPGRFLLLWQAPPSGTLLVHAGSAPRDIDWLTQRLARAGFPSRGGVEAAIRAFQRSQGLTVDGKAGIRTLLKLERLLATQAVPTLQ